MHSNSRPVTSNQQHLHPKLATVVERHLRTPYRPEIAAHNIQAYEALASTLATVSRPLILDSFCGTGHSTATLAQRHPDHLVVGIDQSASRLAKHPGGGGENCLLLQANCEQIWQLMVADGLTVNYHFLLYPNPWPKASHLQRRVHGHPGFPLLLQLRGQLELRSNWQLYVEEFGVAMQLAGVNGHVCNIAPADAGLSLFEQKYQRSGHELWAYRACIAP